MMNLALSAFLGFMTGWMFFIALWQSVRSRTSSPLDSRRRFKCGPLVRWGFIVLSFTAVTFTGVEALAASLCGFLVARALVIRKILGDARYV